MTEATRVWFRIGLMGFGGPAGQIALLHREVVEQRGWVGEDRFLHALNFCTVLPGPEAQQLATYLGWLLHGLRGGLVAGILFVMPGAVVLLGLSWLYAVHGDLTVVQAIFGGLKAAVLALVIDALRRIAKRALGSTPQRLIALGAFVALAMFAVPFPLVVLAGGIVGWIGFKPGSQEGPLGEGLQRARTWRQTFLGGLVGLVTWGAPMLVLSSTLGGGHLFVQMGWFFAKAAVVTFGGAYAVLAYVSQQAVGQLGWLAPGEMVDGLALAETTPGPLILVLQFVGFLAGYRLGAPIDGVGGGLLGTVVTLWMTFVPSLLFVLVAAPYVEQLRANRRLGGAMAAITAAVVGVIGSLALWLGMAALFGETTDHAFGPIAVTMPVWSSIDWFRVLVAGASAVALLRYRIGLPYLLAGASLAGLAWSLTGFGV